MGFHSLLQGIFLTQGLNQVSCLTGRVFSICAIREVLVVVVVLVAQSCLTLCNSPDCSSPGSSVRGILQARMGGVGCHSLLQRIFLTQGSNLGLVHCRQILYH